MAKVKKKTGKTSVTSKAVLERIKVNAAGIDIGSEEIYVAMVDEDVKMFSSFTYGIKELISYLKLHQIMTVAMEATGIYWFPIYEALESEGIEIFVVNGRHVKNVPGRKTDVLDSEWLRELHTFGLLRSSFIPESDIRKLRYFMRLRKDHVGSKARSIQHIQKNLDAMNIKLHTVISDIMGDSGQKIVRKIAEGETCAENLLSLCSNDLRKRKKEQILKSLEGTFRDEYLFALTQAIQVYDFYNEKILDCDKAIEKHLFFLTKDKEEPTKLDNEKAIKHNKPQIEDLHYLIIKLTGDRDATAIAGINDYSLMQLVSETGLDLEKNWPTSAHFTAWMGLAPPLNKSGKSNRSKRKYKKKVNLAGQVFKQLAQNVGNGKNNAMAGFYKRIKARSGAAVANKATARKIAVYYYNLMTKGIDFVEKGIEHYNERYKLQKIDYIHKQAAQLGYQIVPVQ